MLSSSRKLQIRSMTDAEECDDHLCGSLPEVLVLDILSRLNIKTLSKFKCVCKSWNHLISHDPSFHTLHREKSLLQNQFLQFIHWVDRAQPTLGFTFIDLADGTVFKNFEYPMPVSVMVCFSPVCCDLYCFATGWDVYLCNPSMKQVQMLPRSISISMEDDPSNLMLEQKLGFGYIISKGEYIVSNLICKINLAEEGTVLGGEILCEIYTFRPNSGSINPNQPNGVRPSWRAINHGCPRWVNQDDGIVVGATMYWLITDIMFAEHYDYLADYLRGEDELILALDIESEKFEIISPPPDWEQVEAMVDDYWINLVDIKGTLCVTDVHDMMMSSVLEIWCLKEARNGVDDDTDGGRIWVKEYNIKMEIPVPGLEVRGRRPLIFHKSSGNGDVVMVSPVSGKYYVFNVEKGSLVREITGLPNQKFDRESSRLSSYEFDMPLGFCWQSFLTL